MITISALYDATILLKFDEIDPDTKIKEEVTLTIDADKVLISEIDNPLNRYSLKTEVKFTLLEGKSFVHNPNFYGHVTNIYHHFALITQVDMTILVPKRYWKKSAQFSSLRLCSSGLITETDFNHTVLSMTVTFMGRSLEYRKVK